MKRKILSILILYIYNFNLTAQSPMQVAGTATKTAIISGNWGSLATWGGVLPSDDDRILIPNGITVTVDGMITEEFKSIRIDDYK